MVMQTSGKKGMEQMDLLQAFEIIVDKAKGSSLGENHGPVCRQVR